MLLNSFSSTNQNTSNEDIQPVLNNSNIQNKNRHQNHNRLSRLFCPSNNCCNDDDDNCPNNGFSLSTILFFILIFLILFYNN